MVNEGKIVDASFVEVPRQRNSREENKQVKQGEVPGQWTEDPNKLAQKDVDARWTKKNGTSFYGYKNHLKTCNKSKIVTKYTVTDASVHDSPAMEGLLDRERDQGEDLYGDSAYTGEKQEAAIARNGMSGQICEKGHRNAPLTETHQVLLGYGP